MVMMRGENSGGREKSGKKRKTKKEGLRRPKQRPQSSWSSTCDPMAGKTEEGLGQTGQSKSMEVMSKS